jgi:ATP-dependent helicase YprA (DUF1998 family)
MPREINVHELTERLTSTFRRYLYTTNLVADSEPQLRRAVFDALGERDVFTRGPFVGAIPAYKPAATGAELMARIEPPRLHALLAGCDPSQLDLGRPLYQHQVEAIERIQRGRNLVVATGTGSGKTECFLLPILDDAARNPGAGVRAIVVYPMNALANDQLDRLRRMLANVPDVTFGRYTGDTPKDRSDLSAGDAAKLLPNERFSREEIQQDPPHILLTNFAMLEYLLIRPGDAPIFDDRVLRFVVLDEAHTYNGAQGIDVGLLMRRVAERFAGNALQFILTSATLSAGPSDAACAEIARFGAALTGAPFEPQDVVFGETLEHPFESEIAVPLPAVAGAVPDDAALGEWIEALGSAPALRRLLETSALPNAAAALTERGVERMLFALLHDWAPLAALARAVRRGAHDVEALALEAWGEAGEAAARATKWLLVLGANATERADAPALLQCRFHLFYRGLGGASVCLSPSCAHRAGAAGSWSRIYLEERERCAPPCGKITLPMSTCSQCGLPAVAGYLVESGGRVVPIRPANAPAKRVVFAWDELTAEEADDELPDFGREPLCLSCGSLGAGTGPCCEAPDVIRLILLASQEGEVKQCPRCGASARPAPSVLRDFRSGEDATTAVLAEELIRSLPPDGEQPDTLPAQGRRMLVFSDSRQRAAFFAPYLKRTTADGVFNHYLLEAIEAAVRASGGDPVPVNDAVDRFARDTVKRGGVAVVRRYDEERDVVGYRLVQAKHLKQADLSDIKRQARVVLLQHFCSPSRRRSTLPGLALASCEVDLTAYARERIPEVVPELFADGEDVGFDVVQHLLRILILRRALKLDGAGMTCRDIAEGPVSATFHETVQGSDGNRQRYRWDPYAALAQHEKVLRRSYVANVLAKHMGLSPQRDAAALRDLIKRTWTAFADTALEDAGHGGEYYLDYESLLLTTGREWHMCERCGGFTVFPARGLCLAPQCDGRLRALDGPALEAKFGEHHYRRRYTSDEAVALEVREHTAQLTNEQGRKYQTEFMEGKVNVLSSSTTFEMGVDVGTLKAVFLRNVPPSASNYIQRAGRAGRRRGGAAFAVTFCRQTPHDLFHFHHPEAIVEGRVPVPRVNLANRRLARRHVHSFLLGSYLREIGAAKQKLTVDWFFAPDEPAASPAALFREFVEGKARRALLKAIGGILPPECGLTAEGCLDEAANRLYGSERSVFEKHVRGPLDAYAQQLEQLDQQKADAEGGALEAIGRGQKAIGRLIDQLRAERLVDFLSSAHWLPSYAFPQDTVRLVVNQSDWSAKMRLERDRDYGIAEYAPGSEVVADGRVFTSRGLVKRGREFLVRKYRFCPSCRQLRIWEAFETPEPVCSCGTRSKLAQAREYIEPAGFQTKITEYAHEPSLYRMKPPPNTEVFLVGGADPDQFQPHAELRGVTLAYKRDGQLFRANQGFKNRKFRICKSCGIGFDGQKPVPKPHETAWGTPCRGIVSQFDLAHRFTTDTLQIRFDGVAGVPTLSGDAGESFWLSLQTALVFSAAEVLSIPRTDIDGTYRSQTGESLTGEVVIYDRVPGGAGYVERIVEALPRILERTLEKTSTCENRLCDLGASCYVCLRTYGNQFKWDLLRRRVVSSWLEPALKLMTGGRADRRTTSR